MKKSIIHIILLSIFIGISNIAISQQSNDQLDPYDVNQVYNQPVSPAPEAAELTEKSNASVSYSNGALNFSIPLLEVKTKYLNMPVSLNYSANGIKVNALSSTVGVGWSLNAGGVINRVMKGKADEDNVRINLDTVDWNNIRTVYQVAKSVADLGADGENDLFSFKTPNKSGHFVFDRNWNPYLIPKSNTHIDIIFSTSEIDRFIITDENGVKYYFYSKGITLQRPLETLSQYDKTATTSWYLDSIVHPSGDYINLYYSNYQTSYQSGKVYVRTVKPHTPGMGVCYCSEGRNYKDYTQGVTQTNVRIDSIVTSRVTIEFNYQSVPNAYPDYRISNVSVLNAQNELEYQFNLYHTVYGEKIFLDSLQKISGQDEIPPYIFNYISKNSVPPRLSTGQDMFGFYNGVSNNQTLLIRDPASYSNLFYGIQIADRDYSFAYAQYGMLNTIDYPTGGKSTIEYEPHYNTRDSYYPIRYEQLFGPISAVSSDGAPGRVFTVDTVIMIEEPSIVRVLLKKEAHGTHFNSRALCLINDSLVLEITNQLASSLDSCFVPLLPGQYNITVQAEGHFPHDTSFVDLKLYYKITDTVISYSYHENGIRVKRMTHEYNHDLPPSIKRVYYTPYNDTSLTSNTLQQLHFKSNFKENQYHKACNNGSYGTCGYSGFASIPYSVLCPSVTWSADGNGTLSPYGDDFCYRKVTMSNGEYFQNGGTEYTLIAKKDSEGAYLFPPNEVQNGSTNFKSWANGEVIQEKTINSDGEVIMIKDFSYSQDKIDVLYNYDVRRIASGSDLGVIDINRKVAIDFAGIKSSYESYWHRLDTIIITEYFPESNTSITTKELLFYDDTIGMQVTRKIRKSDDGVEYITQTKYPTMYAAGANDSPGQAIDSLNSKHIHNKILESVQMIKYPNEQNPGIFFSQMNMYRLENGLVVPDTAFALEIPNTLAENSYDYSSTEGGTYQFDDHLKAKHVFDLFDEHGNLQQFHAANNFYTCYIWGYGYQFPIAKIENAGYTSVESALQSLGYSITSLQTKTASELKQIFNNLRSHPNMEQAMVSSYTYDPLFGLTSQTGPDGLEQKYEYDDFGRLETIREGHDYILKHFDYNYYVPE